MSRTGLFGGSFDPVHNGHIKLAEFMMNELSLDRMIVIPTFVSPFKTGGSAAEDRYEMCRFAFSGEKYEVSRIETDREGKSYTIDTVKEIRKTYPDDELFLIIGSDQLKNFHKWYKAAEILSEVTLCAVSRETGDTCEELEKTADENLRKYGKVLIKKFEPLEISSTEIRNMAAAGNDITPFVPEAVAGFIKTRGLYREKQ